jgi:hypothetical protein
VAVLVVPVVVAMVAAVPVSVAVAVVATVVPPVMPPPSMGLCLRFRKAGSTCGDCALSCCFVASSVDSLVKVVGDEVVDDGVVVGVVVVPAVLRRRPLEKTRLSA